MNKITAKTALRKYKIFIKKGILKEAPFLIKTEFSGFEKIVIITNDTVNRIYGKQISSLCDSLGVECDIITIGQYLAPSQKHLPVVEFIRPAEFERYHKLGLQMGFKAVPSGPFVRSSYNALDVKTEAEAK